MLLRKEIFLILTVASCAHTEEPSINQLLSIVRQSVPSAENLSLTCDPSATFSGKFARSPELIRRAGPELSGDELYLLPDYSFIYIKWADILPPTIYDKGKWIFDGQYIRLQTDNTIPQKYSKHDRIFFPLTASYSGTRHLFLLGMDYQYEYLRRHQKDGDDFIFLICSRHRVSIITNPQTVKKNLMKKAWKPKYFNE